MSYIDCVQGSTEWMLERHGRVTASRISDVLATLKRGGESAARLGYKLELAAEILTGLSEDKYVSAEMQWGIDNEPRARALYGIRKDVLVDRTGFYVHPTMDRAGASPDGVIGIGGQDVGLTEYKCPKTSTHLKWMWSGVLPEEHEAQVHFQMACVPRAQWCDFCSYDPRLPDDLQLFIVRVPRNEERIAEIEEGVLRFLDELDVLISEIRTVAQCQKQ